jgi:phenylacetate-CoA ligase
MFQPAIETMPREKIEELQLKRLRKIVKIVYENVPFYKRKLDNASVKPGEIKKLEDIKKIPFTTKDDLRKEMPFGMLAVPLERCIELHASSGTTGIPITVCYTPRDIDIWSEVMARCLSMSGLTSKDIFQNPIPYGTFTGAFGHHYGAQRIGALVIPSSGGQSERQIKLMEEYGTTFLCGVASYITYLGQKAKEMGIDTRKLKVRNGMFGAETFTKGMKERIGEQWNMDVHDVYGLTEMCGPGVSCDCDEHDGLHLWEDHFLLECVDPTTGESVDPEEEGELVITTLTKEGIPLLRYRTRDLAFIYDARECDCGRTHVKHSTIKGRSDDMLIIKGTNVFPGQIESVLMENEMVGTNWRMIVAKEKMDQLIVEVEAKRKLTNEERKSLEIELREEIKSVITLTPIVKVLPPGKIPKVGMKAKRVVDLRK